MHFKFETATIIDLVDFCPSDDGEIKNTKYSPESVGRYERDCFAVTAMAEELLDGSASDVAGRVRRAIHQVRTDAPANATLLPLIDALSYSEPMLVEMPATRIVSPHLSSGRLLPDEGRYFLRRSPYGRALVIRGACEELEIKIDVTGKPFRVDRRSVEQSRIRATERFEFGSLESAIIIENGPANDFNELTALLERPDVVEALLPASHGPTGSTSPEVEQQQEDERDAVPSERSEDDLMDVNAGVKSGHAAV